MPLRAPSLLYLQQAPDCKSISVRWRMAASRHLLGSRAMATELKGQLIKWSFMRRKQRHASSS